MKFLVSDDAHFEASVHINMGFLMFSGRYRSAKNNTRPRKLDNPHKTFLPSPCSLLANPFAMWKIDRADRRATSSIKYQNLPARLRLASVSASDLCGWREAPPLSFISVPSFGSVDAPTTEGMNPLDRSLGVNWYGLSNELQEASMHCRPSVGISDLDVRDGDSAFKFMFIE